jgi:HD-GYP domain-containing protein (c-di-GMP phosphodiesterase class II)
MLDALAQAIDDRDPFGTGHAQRVTELAESVAARLRWDEQQLATLRIGARLHDVGKLLLPRTLLAKPGALDPWEWAQIRAHPVAGSTLIAPVLAARAALPCVLYHHERWDGDGYPTGRRGRAIPAVARIVALADAFDAMTSVRPYRDALTPHSALLEIERCAGSQFDPELASAFVAVCSDARAA